MSQIPKKVKYMHDPGRSVQLCEQILVYIFWTISSQNEPSYYIMFTQLTTGEKIQHYANILMQLE